jgi:hypothetical protein
MQTHAILDNLIFDKVRIAANPKTRDYAHFSF